MSQTSSKTRLFLAILAVVVGVFMVGVAPFLIQTSLDRVMTALVKVSAQKPAYASGILLFSVLYPLYRAIIFIAGITLIVIARSIREGKEWTFPVGLLASAFPASGGMFMMLPYVSFVPGLPLPMLVSLTGLLFFLCLILLRKVNTQKKIAQLLTLTFCGIMTAHAFVIAVGGMRQTLTRLEKPLYSGIEGWVLAWSSPVQFICVILLFVAIYKIAARKMEGWWMALVAAVSLVAMNTPTQIIRTLRTDATSIDYLIGALLSTALLVILLLPKIKRALFEEPAS
ncbi:MAG TPA: hypothetical protein PKZ26_03505 [Anaerolineaceae bacterium]|mgnify:FL=1|jgi:hypothetical protein|nr:hypothetical protein [Chloroflexota bacterium]HNS06957.1 hypothetical protein [Anaerolineaceae bacterium]HOQ69137.1 hypothetical protein [Anaerolineaceae bacterium]HOS53093.1 hypothetical protein [Anaerolineaceae bacterium]HPD63014.1 hypothetical protein [Anaerolineaceae bacterium]